MAASSPRSVPTSPSSSSAASRAVLSIARSAAARPLRVVIELQAAGAGLDRDHVDGVADRVVQVAGDAASAPRRRPAAARARARRCRRLGGLPAAPLLGADVAAPPPTARRTAPATGSSRGSPGRSRSLSISMPIAAPNAPIQISRRRACGLAWSAVAASSSPGPATAGSTAPADARIAANGAASTTPSSGFAAPHRRRDRDGDHQGQRDGQAGAVGRHQHDRDSAQRHQHRDQPDVADQRVAGDQPGEPGDQVVGIRDADAAHGSRVRRPPPWGYRTGHHRGGARRRVADRTLDP